MSPVGNFEVPDPYTYLNGFPSYHESEAVPGALPVARNSPQKPPYGLYAEKLSGSAFTAPRHTNRQTWLYRILPSASHGEFRPLELPHASSHDLQTLPTQLRWDPFSLPAEGSRVDFVDGLRTLCGAGSPALKHGLQISAYAFNAPMREDSALYSADGDWLIVPQLGALDVRTELGRLLVRPTEIAVIPRGVRFRVALHPASSAAARGYILEPFSAAHFELPELGPIGSNGLANPRDFQVPRATYIDAEPGPHTLMAKFGGSFYAAEMAHSPFDVVAWHGNYYPFKYDLGRFNTIGTVSYDHPDPSIFTVLTVPSAVPGTALADFVLFPPRWLVAEDTFRPPWFHRNTMAEFMGLICGEYDAKTAGGFVPGGASLHNVMAGHGPDGETAEKASECRLAPQKVGDGALAFMFETSLAVGVSAKALECSERQRGYSLESWGSVKRRFKLPEGVKRVDL